MAATTFLLDLCGINYSCLAWTEKQFLECYVFMRFCSNFENYRDKNIGDFSVYQQECFMQEEVLIRQMLQDILLTEEYDISGIACYTGYPEEVIYDITVGINNQPSFELARKIIALHSSVRPHYYHELLSKILGVINSSLN
jgi:hypothetical protein